MPKWRNGIRGSLKSCWAQAHVGSTPSFGTKLYGWPQRSCFLKPDINSAKVKLMKLSIIIPTYNEQQTINELLEYVQSVKYPIDYEIIIIDDASIDRTYEKGLSMKLKNKPEEDNIRIFKNTTNRGKGFSVRKGIKEARGEIIIIQDADKEYDPKEIPALIQPLLKKEAKVVYGSRFLNNPYPKNMSWKAYLANKALTKLTNFLYGLKLTDMETCYKAFRADIVKNLNLKANRFSFEPEITALLARRKIAIKELPISYHGRTIKEGKKIKTRDFIYAVFVLIFNIFS